MNTTRKVLNVYLDASVIFAAVLSQEGGSRKLFQLSAARVIRIVLGTQVLKETEEVVRRKIPASLPELARLLSAGHVDVEESNAADHLDEARKFVSYRPDAHVLAEAMSLGVDWFVTHDKEHFLRARPRKPLPLEIGTPGDLLQTIKVQLSGG